MNDVPAYVSIVFILTTFAAVAIFLQAVRSAGLHTISGRILLFLLPLWIVLQTVLGIGGFYQATSVSPPRLLVFGVLPALAMIIIFFAFFGSFIERLPIRFLTIIHVVRIPVELTIFWLFIAGFMPRMMTFQSLNFDIVTGVLSLIIFFAAFRRDSGNRPMLIAFNIVGLVLLFVIVSIAAFSIPSPIQQLSFDQPNRAVLFFPYIFLPTIVVPIVLACHIASLYKTLRGNLR